MSNSNQCFFSLDKLEKLRKKFDKPMSGKKLKGFVFTPGCDDKKNSCFFAFPVYSDKVKAGSDGDILVQNTDSTLSGCPYPPPCNSKALSDGCYEISLE